MKKEVRPPETFIQWLIPGSMTLMLFIGYAILIGLFLFLLDKKLNTGFGVVEILFALGASFLWVAFLNWVKSIIHKNPYLGLIIGLVIVVLLANALFIRYNGPNTMIFSALGALSSVSYLMYLFYNARSEDAVNAK